METTDILMRLVSSKRGIDRNLVDLQHCVCTGKHFCNISRLLKLVLYRGRYFSVATTLDEPQACFCHRSFALYAHGGNYHSLRQERGFSSYSCWWILLFFFVLTFLWIDGLQELLRRYYWTNYHSSGSICSDSTTNCGFLGNNQLIYCSQSIYLPSFRNL